MAPTVQRPGGGGGGVGGGAGHRPTRPQDQDEKRSDLICRVKYSNTLPDIVRIFLNLIITYV